MKSRPNQKIEAALDQALADTFPASDPIAALQPTSAGRGPKIVRHEPKEAAGFTPPRKDFFPHPAGF